MTDQDTGSLLFQLDQLTAKATEIRNMVCPDLEETKLDSIRLRVRSTVDSADPSEGEYHATSAIRNHVLPEEERDHKCVVCGNTQQSRFVHDRKQADMICTDCGAVACEGIIDRGSQYRNFEGEEDRNHDGASYNPLFSNAYNTATGLTRGAYSAPGSTSTSGGGNAGRLRKAHRYIELNLCHLGEGARSSKSPKHETRVGYKDQQKKKAFASMKHVAEALQLHGAVLERAKELYAKHRNNREVLKDPEGVIAACLCEAYDQCSLEGRKWLEAEMENEHKVTRRNMLHTTRLTGKGERVGTAVCSSTTGGVTPLELKPLSSWDMMDCRTWLIAASRAIAKHWHQQQGLGSPLEELEGSLVGNSLILCEYLAEPSSKPRAAGKKLLLMNAKKLSSILGDVAAATAIHKELRGLVNRQAVRRNIAAGQKAYQRRIQQSRRKLRG